VKQLVGDLLKIRYAVLGTSPAKRFPILVAEIGRM
jgi:hypothetical protein